MLRALPKLHCPKVLQIVNKEKASQRKLVQTVVDVPPIHYTVMFALTPCKKVNYYPCGTNMNETGEYVIDLVHESCISPLPGRSHCKHSPWLRALPNLNDIPRSPKQADMVVPMKTPCKGTSTYKPLVFEGFGALVKALSKLAEFGGGWNVHQTPPPIQVIDGSFSSHRKGEEYHGISPTFHICSKISRMSA